ncbi:hypothetical protein ACLI09_09770 [Flavobacterium sp. RHBU_24]|uniref:hypothetical protein n=1 Tax=Flavobacterium sp. RHBU_24 TaxID=3391185 RepID=UPI0039853CFF
MRRLTVLETDRLNIALMLLSLVPAFLLPFSTFLFVYAFLGPLHYLTEINWLHKKKYFTQNRYEYGFIYLLIAIIGLLILTKSPLRRYVPLLTFIVFFGTLGFITLKNNRQKVVFTMLFAIVGALFYFGLNTYFRIIFSTLMPTIIHVFVFTGLFILIGALKSSSTTGKISLGVFVTCALVTLFAGTGLNMEIAGEAIQNNYSSFRKLSKVLMALFGMFGAQNGTILPTPDGSSLTNADLMIYFSTTGIKVMRFIAFAYTYHYLNWFSKTSVIQWHNTKRINLVAIIAVWVASVALYILDYKTGLKWLFLLSFGHVLLEFPLNHRSFMEVKERLYLKFLR